MLAEVNLHDVCRIRRIIILKNCTHKALIKQIIALLLSFMIIISISVPSYAINYDSRTKAIKTSVKKAQKIIADNPINTKHQDYSYKDLTNYSRLTPRQKKLHNSICKKVKQLKEVQYSCQKYGDDLDKAVDALMYDEPLINEFAEFYYYEEDGIDYLSVSYFEFQTDGRIKKVPVTTEKQKEKLKKTISAYEKKVDRMASLIVKGMPKNISTIDKYRYLALCLCFITKYNNKALENPDSQDKKTSKAACYDAPFVYGSAICQGYALAYMYLCKKANLYCRFVTGNVDDNETSGHAWNLVKINKGTYFVDVTWMDGNSPTSADWFRYFMLTQSELQEDHKYIDDGVKATGRYSFRSRFAGIY